MIDFDVGLRNLDLIMGCERRVVYDFVNVIHGEATLNQALIKDKRFDNLFVLAASQTRDKDALTKEGVREGAQRPRRRGLRIHRLRLARRHRERRAAGDVLRRRGGGRDQSRSLLGARLRPHPRPAGSARPRRAENGERVKEHLLLTRYSPSRVEGGEMLSIDDVEEILGLKMIGVIPESGDVLNASNKGVPVILDMESPAGQAYDDAVARLLGETRPMRFTQMREEGLLQRCSEVEHGHVRFPQGARRTPPRSPRSACASSSRRSAARSAAPDYLPLLRRELLEVIRKYVNVDVDAVKVDLVKDGEHDVLDISVSLPEGARRGVTEPVERAQAATLVLAMRAASSLLRANMPDDRRPAPRRHRFADAAALLARYGLVLERVADDAPDPRQLLGRARSRADRQRPSSPATTRRCIRCCTKPRT